jgi:hypothetical protein
MVVTPEPTLISSPTNKVIQLNALPTGYTMVMGTPQSGLMLSLLSTLADTDGLGPFNYQWYCSGTPIVGATNATYKVTLGDVGERIGVNVQYVDGYGTLEFVDSTQTPSDSVCVC